MTVNPASNVGRAIATLEGYESNDPVIQPEELQRDDDNDLIAEFEQLNAINPEAPPIDLQTSNIDASTSSFTPTSSTTRNE